MRIAAGVLLMWAAACGGAPAPRAHTITIVDATRFSPATLDVAVGDTVTWVNQDVVPHTATSTTGGFDSGRIDPEQSWTYTVAKAGELAYVCTYHPTMKGTLRVK
ncbi:MAG TPA: cupredoxin family copper-binding protein [Vicinamibacterales bacterium]|nr:cupredoxin family copper-binding protein [Vicinamibacterales bacterium]